jgi:hypothetical protein
MGVVVHSRPAAEVPVRRSRDTQIAIVLVLVGIVLAGVAIMTDVADWVIVVLFIVAAVATNVAWPGRGSDE